MTSVPEFAAGFTISRVINQALLKINGAPLSRHTSSGAEEVDQFKDSFILCNRALLDSYDWFFLLFIRHLKQLSQSNVSVGGEFVKHRPEEVPHKPYQNYPENYFPIAAEELVEQYPHYYINVLITSLARELATTYGGNLQKRQMLQNVYIQDLGNAKIADKKSREKYTIMGIYNGSCFL